MQHTIQECKSRLLSVRDALNTVSGKWKIPILIALHEGNFRFRELHRRVQGITAKMLSRELKELEQNKLVHRRVLDNQATMVEYSLTSHGQTVGPLLEALYKWGSEHRQHVLHAEKAVVEELVS